MNDRRSISIDGAVWAVIAAAVVLFWLVSTSWRPWDIADVGGFSADFYDEQARSFLRGRLDVRPEVPGPEGFLIDGRTYLYYGPFLAIVRVPLALFGDVFVGRVVRISMLVALVVLGRWSARLARIGRLVVAGRAADDASDRGPIVLFVAAVLFSPVLYMAAWTSVYHETELWALTLAVVALTLTVEWAASRFTDDRALFGAAVAVLATTATRAPIGLGAAVGLGCLGLGLSWRSRRAGPRLGRTGATAVVAGLVPLVVHGVVNKAKFGSWLSVPGDRQLLSLTDPTRAAFFESTGGSFFDLRFLPTTVAQYLRPDTIRFERLVPGIRFGPLAENYGSLDVETVTPAASLTVSATLLVILALAGVAWLVRARARTWTLLVITGCLGAVPTFLIGFVANRYLVDMLPPLVLAGSAGVWVLAGRWRPGVVRVAASLLVVWGLWVNVALATWTLEMKSPGFSELRSDVDAAVFGGGDVGVVVTGAGTPVPRDGVVGVADSCAAVYIAEQGRWVALERAPGVFETTGAVESFDETWPVVARIGEKTLTVRSLDVGGVAVVLDDESTDADEPYVVTVDRVPPFDYRVVADPVSGEAFVEVGGRVRLLPASIVDEVGAGGIGRAGAGTARSALCETLAGRAGIVQD